MSRSTAPLANPNPPTRPVCARCRRPESVCYCAQIPSLPSRTRVVFLQHPRERKVAIGTCLMTHLALPNSELHRGTAFDDHAALEAAIANAGEGGAFVLFPGEGAVPPEALAGRAPSTVIVVDGTWTTARKLVQRSRVLSSLPRVGLSPSSPSNYRIRSEPAENCVSTIEATVELLELLEGGQGRFRAALAAFDRMVEIQIAHRLAHPGPSRYARARASAGATLHPARPSRALPLEGEVRDRRRTVLLFVEALPARGTGEPGELVRLLASRGAADLPTERARFEACVRPAARVGEQTSANMGLTAERLARGESLGAALARFAAFLDEGDRLAGWGPFGRRVLEAASAQAAPEVAARLAAVPFFDLRPSASRALGRRVPGVELAVEALGGALPAAWADGRGGERIVAIEALYALLLARSPPDADGR